jgi:hypothetical protein
VVSRRSTFWHFALLSLALGAPSACKDRAGESSPETDQAAKAVEGDEAPEDAGPATATRSEPALPDPPRPGLHLDGVDTSYRPNRPVARPRQGREIELVLRSSPPGASASIDGKQIGVTPTFWRGTSDDQPHEYTFVKEGYAMARYRFVATHSGVVHGTLQPLVKEEEEGPSDAGAE